MPSNENYVSGSRPHVLWHLGQPSLHFVRPSNFLPMVPLNWLLNVSGVFFAPVVVTLKMLLLMIGE